MMTTSAPVSVRAPSRVGAPRRHRAARASARASQYGYIAGDAEQADMAAYFSQRTAYVREHFPGSLGLDDYMARVETVLGGAGFDGENSIALASMCRDEIVMPLKTKIEDVFGESFNTNGLGGLITLGKTGMGACLSHSPISASNGKEKYVFFTYPHVGVNAEGTLAAVSRFNRPGPSSACGAMCGCLGLLQKEGVDSIEPRDRFSPIDPELSILKNRLAVAVKEVESPRAAKGIQAMDVADLTIVGEAAFRRDLEEIIAVAVDTDKADYAVVSGVHIHSFGVDYDGPDPRLEYIMPGAIYTVVDGKRTDLDLGAVPPLPPRMLRAMAMGAASSRASADMSNTDKDSMAGAYPGSLVQAPEEERSAWLKPGVAAATAAAAPAAAPAKKKKVLGLF